MGTLKSWIPILTTIGLTVIGALTPAVQAFWSNHPEFSLIFAGVYAVIKNLLPSPVAAGSQPGAVVTVNGQVTKVVPK